MLHSDALGKRASLYAGPLGIDVDAKPKRQVPYRLGQVLSCRKGQTQRTLRVAKAELQSVIFIPRSSVAEVPWRRRGAHQLEQDL